MWGANLQAVDFIEPASTLRVVVALFSVICGFESIQGSSRAPLGSPSARVFVFTPDQTARMPKTGKRAVHSFQGVRYQLWNLPRLSPWLPLPTVCGSAMVPLYPPIRWTPSFGQKIGSP